ncbi:MAG: hypothetical protein AAF709_08730, partial [Pseudomonadota bacterium]
MAVVAMGGDKHRHVLLMRFGLINAVGFALVIAAYLQGWLNGLFAENVWIAALIITTVFVYGLGLCGLKIWQTTSALDDVKSGQLGPGSRARDYLETADFSDPDNRMIQIN